MRDLVVLTLVSLDGVIQAPGGEGEDPSGSFDLEGWTVPYVDDVEGNEETIQIKGDVVAEIENLKHQDGPMLQVYGSGNLVQTLLANHLVDQLWLKVFPV